MGTSISSLSSNGLDFLLSAAANGEVDRVQQWLFQWQNTAHPSPPRGPPKQPMLYLQPALHVATRNNHTAVVKLLLAEGCDIDPGMESSEAC